jgi:hypothetical protein
MPSRVNEIDLPARFDVPCLRAAERSTVLPYTPLAFAAVRVVAET